MGYPVTKNRMTDGGNVWEVEGQLNIKSGGLIKVEAGAMLVIDPGADVDRSSTVDVDTSQIVQHYQVATPAAVSATALHAAAALAAAAQDVTTAITNPDYPRTVTVKGNAAGIAGDVVITGTDISGAEITDTIALNGATEVEGAKAFKTVTNIHLPVETHAGTDTVSVGIGKKFGMPHKIANAALLLVKLFNASADTGTLAVSATDLSKNLFALNGTPDGAKPIDLYYLV